MALRSMSVNWACFLADMKKSENPSECVSRGESTPSILILSRRKTTRQMRKRPRRNPNLTLQRRRPAFCGRYVNDSSMAYFRCVSCRAT